MNLLDSRSGRSVRSDRNDYREKLEYSKCSVRSDCLHFVSEHVALTCQGPEKCQSCHWSCPKSCPRSCQGNPLSWPEGAPTLRGGGYPLPPPQRTWTVVRSLLRSRRRTFLCHGSLSLVRSVKLFIN